MPASRPNILLIHSDQHRYDCVGAHGHPVLMTPNLDRLAAEGADFSHAFCPSPICSPARASLLTGQWPIQHGLLFTEIAEAYRPMRPNLPTFSALLNEAGYYLGYVGKWHVDEVLTPLDYGFHDYVPEQEYTLWRNEQGLPPPPGQNGWLGETDQGITPGQSRLAWGATETLQLLRRATGERQPFFIRWDPSEPHLPNRVPEPFAGLYPPESIPPWPSFRDPLSYKPTIQRRQLANWGVENWSWKDWAPIVSRYLGEISLLDSNIGRLLAALDELGLANDTLVVYTTDHGDMCGAHGMMDKHYVMYDDVVRVPLIMRWKGVISSGQQPDAFVSSAIDLAATFCEVAGVTAPASFKGDSLLPLVTRKRRRNGRTDIYASYHGNQFGLYSQRMVRDQRWKYIWNPTAEDELYDLGADPAELYNRAADFSCAGELARLRARMVAWLEQTGDPLLNEWTRRQLTEPVGQIGRWKRDSHYVAEPAAWQRGQLGASRAQPAGFRGSDLRSSALFSHADAIHPLSPNKGESETC